MGSVFRVVTTTAAAAVERTWSQPVIAFGASLVSTEYYRLWRCVYPVRTSEDRRTETLELLQDRPQQEIGTICWVRVCVQSAS